ncbi:MAG: sigma factor [Bryobacteraceae bacterium]
MKAISTVHASQDDLYKDAVEKYGCALQRLVSAYEADPDKRRDLSQDIHFQLWRSFQQYDGRCSLRTWIYRVAHHVAASYVMRERRLFSGLVSLAELETFSGKDQAQLAAENRINVTRLFILIQRLKRSIARSSSAGWRIWTRRLLERSPGYAQEAWQCAYTG